MAIIKCPECGKDISTNAKTCVHCGSSVTVCPDCNTPLAGGTETCPICGCVLEKEQEKKSERIAAEPLTEEQKLRYEFDRLVNHTNDNVKTAKIAGGFLTAIEFIFFIAFIVVFSLWCKDMFSADKLVRGDKILSFLHKDYGLLRTLLALACVCGIVSFIYECAKDVAIMGAYAEKLQRLGIDRDRLLLMVQNICHADPIAYTQMGVEATQYGMYSAVNQRNMEACYEICNPSARNRSVLFVVVLSILFALDGIIIGLAVDNVYLKGIYKAQFLGVEFTHDPVWIAVVCACLIVTFIVYFIYRAGNKQMKEWIDRNLA